MKFTAFVFAAALVPAMAFAGPGSDTGSSNTMDMSEMQGQPQTDEPALGVTVMDLSSDLRTHFGAPKDSGLLVSKVDSDSAAQKAGIKVGDIITKIGTNKLATASDIDTFLGTAQQGTQQAGQKVAIQVIRNQKTLSLHVMPQAAAGPSSSEQGMPPSGAKGSSAPAPTPDMNGSGDM